MPPRSAEEKARRKILHEQKKEARRIQKEKQEADKKKKQQSQAALASSSNGNGDANATGDNGNSSSGESKKEQCYFLELPEDSLHEMLSYLVARDLGAVSMTCRSINFGMDEARSRHLYSRLLSSGNINGGSNQIGKLRVPMKLCKDEIETRSILDRALQSGGKTGRLITKKSKRGAGDADEYMAYARFIEEAVLGQSYQKFPGEKPSALPPIVNGRFASASPEHSLCRVGGGDRSGAGGSGTASWGVGKRGQLGHGKRKDESAPRMLLGGIGYGIRIVQVSAGGGLVRVAHSLLLTSTGQVLSFGNAQYGQLGHGFASGKQLPDVLRPQYVSDLSHLHCTCVSAGELHSAVVTSDGDLYTWGDAFCGQLGSGSKKPQLTPEQVTKGGLDEECVLSVDCGARHTLALTEDGEVFSFGLGHFGVLGRSFTPFEYHGDAALSNAGVDLTEAEQEQRRQQREEQQEQLARIDNLDDDMRNHLDLLANLTLNDNSDQCIPKVVDSLQGTKIVGVSAGHRHSIFLDQDGGVYTCGSGFGPREKQEIPMKVMEFANDGVQIMQISAGVDISMAVSTTGDVYSWGKTKGGRIGLADDRDDMVCTPQKVPMEDPKDGSTIQAVDVECGYVHSMIVGCDGSLYLCGGVGVDGEEDGQQTELSSGNTSGAACQIQDFNIWHRVKEPREETEKVKWKKYGKYELKGRSKMMKS